MNVTGIILAAGGSRRMKSGNKLMKQVMGKTMLQLVVENAMNSNLNAIRVILGNDHEAMKTTLEDYPVETMVNSQWKDGMSSSIKNGMNGLSEKSEGVLFLLGDMPKVTSRVINKLLVYFSKENGQKIIFPLFEEQQGNPVIFPRKYFEALMTLSGDSGAKSILRDENSIGIEMDSNCVLIDIDTESDLENYDIT